MLKAMTAMVNADDVNDVGIPGIPGAESHASRPNPVAPWFEISIATN